MKSVGKKHRIHATVRRKITVARLLPNIVTLAALSSGLSAVRLALEQQWAFAVIAIIIASVLDALDGRVARYLNQSSHFGGELDSLSDAIAFGVAPALMIYLYSLKSLGNWGWIMAVGFVVCMVLRLARFNTLNLIPKEASDTLPEKPLRAWEKSFFVGVPAPVGALLALVPLYLKLLEPTWHLHPQIIGAYILCIALLLVSRIPTYSFKGHTVAPRFALPLLLGITLILAGLITEPWITLSLAAVAYLASLPLSWWAYRQHLIEAQ